jgi:hypothetical protein
MEIDINKLLDVINCDCDSCAIMNFCSSDENKNIECFDVIIRYLTKNQSNNSNVPSEWKFAMPINQEAFSYCVTKLVKLGKKDNNKETTHFVHFNGKNLLDTGDIGFRDLNMKELNLTEFLALPEFPTQPEKKQLPDWVYDPWIMAKNFENDLWKKTSFVSVIRNSDGSRFFYDVFGERFNKIAPFNKDYIWEKTQHPDQITTDDLKNYHIPEVGK